MKHYACGGGLLVATINGPGPYLLEWRIVEASLGVGTSAENWSHLQFSTTRMSSWQFVASVAWVWFCRTNDSLYDSKCESYTSSAQYSWRLRASYVARLRRRRACVAVRDCYRPQFAELLDLAHSLYTLSTTYQLYTCWRLPPFYHCLRIFYGSKIWSKARRTSSKNNCNLMHCRARIVM